MLSNFGKLIGVALPSAILMALFFSPIGEVDFFATFIGGEMTKQNYFGMLVDAFVFRRFGKYWYLAIVSLVVFVLSQCLLVVKIDRHMKTGEMSAFPIRRATRLFGAMLLYVAVVLTAVLAVSFATMGIAYFICNLFGVKVSVIVLVCLNFVIQVFTGYLFASLVLAFPIKYSENYTFSSALSYSVRTTNSCKKQIWLFALWYPSIRLVTNVLAYFTRPIWCYLFYFLFFAYFTVYIPCMAYALFYDTIGGVRRDLSTSIFD